MKQLRNSPLWFVGLLRVCPILILVLVILARMMVPSALAKPQMVSEVPGNVTGILTAELAYYAAFDGYIPCGSRAEAMAQLGGKPREWKLEGCWSKIGWRPDGTLQGAYWVETDGKQVTVHGVCDADGDGRIAEYAYSALNGQAGTLLTISDPRFY